MTDQQSLDDIKTLLLTYPGMTSAVVFSVPDRDEVHVRFRCTDAASLRSIAASSVWSNVLITLGDPKTRICAEPKGVCDLPCDIKIPDTDSRVPTHPERFGVYISADLADQGLISEAKLTQLHTQWKTRLANRKPRPPAALPPEVSATCKQQIAAINKVQRYLGWTDISFYRIVNGKPNWNGVPLFRERDEFTLSKSTYRIGDRKFTTQVICVAGHIFSFVTRPSIKKHCFGTPIDIQTNILTDPAEDHAGQSRNHPKTFKDWHANGAAESNGWSALLSSETYAVHLADADYTVLAARGDEFLMSRIDDDSGRIYYASAADPARAVGQSFADAMLQT